MTGLPQPGALEYLHEELDQLLAVADAELSSQYRGDGYELGPVHTAYVPAHRFEHGTVAEWGARAVAAVEEFAPDPAGLAVATGIEAAVAAEVFPLVLAKLGRQPIEDLRIDFEDGYGVRADDTEDAHARAAARALAAALGADTAPPCCGIRVKSLEPPTRRRAVRTLEVFCTALLDAGRPLPSGLRITLPKVTSPAQVAAMDLVCRRLETACGTGRGQRLQFEIQVEMPQVVMGSDGAATIARCVHAAPERLAGLHFGTYDYSAALGIAAGYQSMEHPAADYAKAVMQVAAAGTGVRLSDGSSAVLPVGGRDQVTAAWRLHARLVRRSLERGFYQGWDLHPGQLVSRYAATYAFYREGLGAATGRLRAHAGPAADGQEEPATVRALAGYLLSGLTCGAFTEAEVTGQAGLSIGDLRVAARRGILPDRDAG
ncbi:MAG TPA: aldolase/citrate lyase family protein [Streptosporangiaceae bacterium]